MGAFGPLNSPVQLDTTGKDSQRKCIFLIIVSQLIDMFL